MTDRERFEAWAKREGFLIAKLNGEFIDPSTRFAWLAWQARCPEGWMVVPITPTQYQQNAGSVDRYHKQGNCEDIYKTMLAAAAQPGEEI